MRAKLELGLHSRPGSMRPSTGIIVIFKPIAITAVNPLPRAFSSAELARAKVISDDEVILVTDMLSPHTMLISARQALLIRLVRNKAYVALAAVHAGRAAVRSWWRAIEADIAVLTRAPQFEKLNGASLATWCAAIAVSPAGFRQHLMTACRDDKVAMRSVWTASASLVGLGVPIACEDCGKLLGSKQALAVHKNRAHKHIHYVHFLTRTTTCEVCMTQLWSRHKIVEHLQDKAPFCRAFLSAFRQPLPVEEVMELDELARLEARTTRHLGARRARALRPAMRMPGPLVNLPVAEQSGGHHPLGLGRRWLS